MCPPPAAGRALAGCLASPPPPSTPHSSANFFFFDAAFFGFLHADRLICTTLLGSFAELLLPDLISAPLSGCIIRRSVRPPRTLVSAANHPNMHSPPRRGPRGWADRCSLSFSSAPPQVYHPEQLRPGSRAQEPKEPPLRCLPSPQDGLRHHRPATMYVMNKSRFLLLAARFAYCRLIA